MRFSATDYLEEYEQLEEQLSRDQTRRQRRAARPSRPDPTAVRAELTDLNDTIMDFVPSYAAALDPLHHERQWVIESVAPFYQQNLITDVTRLVKGGKEANVYCCTANPALGMELLAAKLYRPRMLRHLRNDALYKEGRMILDSDGKEVRGGREARAMKKKTQFGQHLGFMTWIVHEFEVQQQLFEAGADVPRPVAHQANTILMAYLGDERQAAPTLNQVAPEPDEAQPLFDRVMANIELMLNHHYIHGDLSAYNILYWDGQITIIDFPQLVDARSNPHALKLLQRDVARVVEYFSRHGVRADSADLAMGLWDRYQNGEIGI